MITYYGNEFPEHLLTNFSYDTRTFESVLRSTKLVKQFEQAAKNAGIKIILKIMLMLVIIYYYLKVKQLWYHNQKDKLKFWKEFGELRME